ncbi:MAG: PQQ-binding-like beta-propeller repeat protein [Pseudomonadota bacterium]
MRCFITLLLVASLVGCSKPTKPPLEGTRIDILPADQLPVQSDIEFEIPAATPMTTWSQLAANAQHNPGPLTLATPLTRVWQARVRNTGDSLLTIPPIVIGDLVIALGQGGNVQAHDIENGRLIWQRDLVTGKDQDAAISGGLAALQDTVFVTTGLDVLQALSLADGATVWSRTLPAPARAAPALDQDQLSIMTLDNQVIILSAQTGEELWRYAGLSNRIGTLHRAPPSITNTSIFAAFSARELTLLSRENGRLIWSQTLSQGGRTSRTIQEITGIGAAPIMTEDRIITLGYSGYLTAFDFRTGNKVWEVPTFGTQTPFIAGDALFVLSADHLLQAYRLSDGALGWVELLVPERLRRREQASWQGPVLAGGGLIITGSDRTIRSIDPTNGEERWRLHHARPILAPPVVARDTLLIMDEGGILTAYRAGG